MKFCPYCGANLFDENVLFCSNCGKKLPPHEAGITEPLTEEMRPEPEKTPKVEPSTKKKGRKKKASNKKATRVVDEPPIDDGYDGYYDDVQPPDLDRVKEGLDKELIKKIVALKESKQYVKKFIRYKEGAEKYSLGMTKFRALAKEAQAVYKVDGIALVNCEIFEKYLETFREC